MALAAWAVACDTLKAYAEPANLTTLRWTTSGTREVILASIPGQPELGVHSAVLKWWILAEIPRKWLIWAEISEILVFLV